MEGKESIASFFHGWNETMIWSCLQGEMGAAIPDQEQAPTAARLEIGDFCFFAGVPNLDLVRTCKAAILVPRDAEWGRLIEAVWGDGVEKGLRYAIKKEPNVFHVGRLTELAASLESDYELRLMDESLYTQALGESWSRDLCSQFTDAADYIRRGVGVAVLHQGRLAAGASSYTVYQGGIEIEIDTKPAHRQKGLATACGAQLILECLQRGLYPSWDAHDLRSVSLAQKLGYHLEGSYVVYTMGHLH